jgi:DNA-directed RNA polymerase subunit RPC12/RpoP
MPDLEEGVAADPGSRRPDHEMDELTDTTRPPTCPECGTTRNGNAVPYLAVEHGMAEYTCAACGARFESWTPGDLHHSGGEGASTRAGGEGASTRAGG